MENKFNWSGILRVAAVAGCLAVAAASSAAVPPPPGPPKGVRTFPRATWKPPVPKVIRLPRGKHQITAAELKKAPTLDQANRRVRAGVEKPSQPLQVRIPGTPRIIRGASLPPSAHNTVPKPVGKPKAPAAKAKTAPKKSGRG